MAIVLEIRLEILTQIYSSESIGLVLLILLDVLLLDKSMTSFERSAESFHVILSAISITTLGVQLQMPMRL